MTSSACSTLTALDSPSRPPLLALPGTARMLSATVNGSIKHAAVADRKGGVLIVCARASNVFGITSIPSEEWRTKQTDGVGSDRHGCKGTCASKTQHVSITGP